MANVLPIAGQIALIEVSQSYFHELISANNLPNLLLFLAGLGGIAVAIYTLRDIRTQTGLLREYVTATKQMAVVALRPKLEVKHLFLIPDKSISGRAEDGNDWRIGCLVANIGGSKAEVVESDVNIPNLGIGSLESLATRDSVPHYAKNHSFGTFVVQPGERQERMVTLDANSDEVFRFRIGHQTAERRAREGLQVPGTSPIICFGFFRYKDESGIERLTGFGWEWNKRDMSFARLNHPNYEYQD